MQGLYRLLILLCGVGCVGSVSANADGAGDDAAVDAAPDYRAWQHVKTMIIQPDHALAGAFGGIHHIYANPVAMAGLSQGRYQIGAVFVFDLIGYETKEDTIVETDRKRLDVMRFDPDRFVETGGWGFASYQTENSTQRITQDVVGGCFECHKSVQASGYVFSKYRP
jgi:hypothetical protein